MKHNVIRKQPKFGERVDIPEGYTHFWIDYNKDLQCNDIFFCQDVPDTSLVPMAMG